MDKASDVVFNNQAVDGPSGAPAMVHTPSSGQQPLQYNQGRHHELLEAMARSDYQQAVQTLNSVTNPDQLLNLMEPTFRQSIVYKSVVMPDAAAAMEFTRLFIAKGAIILGKDLHGQSPLFYICKEGRIDLLHLFLENKADINETDNFRQTPIFYAARDGKVEMVRAMIANKANPNHRDRAEQTALFYAARDGRIETVKALVEGGANVNIADGKRQTALSFARKQNHQEVDEYLVAAGAINTKDGTLKQGDLRKSTKLSGLNSSQDEERRQRVRRERAKGAKVERQLQKEAEAGAVGAKDGLQTAVHRRQPELSGPGRDRTGGVPPEVPPGGQAARPTRAADHLLGSVRQGHSGKLAGSGATAVDGGVEDKGGAPVPSAGGRAQAGDSGLPPDHQKADGLWDREGGLTRRSWV